MASNRTLFVPVIVVGIALILVAILYWAEPAGSLPKFFPGYEPGSSHHHLKHGIAAFVLGAAALVFAWAQAKR